LNSQERNVSGDDVSEDYQSRLLAYTEGKDPLAMQSETPRLLAELISGVDDAKLSARPAPEKWSVIEIIAHLAEDELTATWRYRQMIENPGVALAGFDQDLWAHLGNYRSWTPAEAVGMFGLLREANLRMLRLLTPQQWGFHGIHAERGLLTVRDLARHMAGHDCNHIDQLRRILAKG
jgi:DinB superfamily